MSSKPLDNTVNKKKNNSITNEQRSNLIEMCNVQSFPLKEAAEILKIKYTTAWKIVNEFEKTQRKTRKPTGGPRKLVLTCNILNDIEEIVSIHPDFTLKEIKERLQQRNQELEISLTSIDNALKSLMITLKKSHRELDRVNSENSIQLRKNYAVWFNEKFGCNYRSVIFVDESGFNLTLRRLQSRSKRGTRSNIKVNFCFLKKIF